MSQPEVKVVKTAPATPAGQAPVYWQPGARNACPSRRPVGSLRSGIDGKHRVQASRVWTSIGAALQLVHPARDETDRGEGRRRDRRDPRLRVHGFEVGLFPAAVPDRSPTRLAPKSWRTWAS